MKIVRSVLIIFTKNGVKLQYTFNKQSQPLWSLALPRQN